MTTDISELGLEELIVRQMTLPLGAWTQGRPEDYDRAHAVDLAQLSQFLIETQPDISGTLEVDSDSPTRQKFLARLQGEITKSGVVAVLRNGIKHGPHDIDLFYGAPTPGNAKAAARFAANRFTVTRQLRYSPVGTQLALDLAIFINGLPVATFELKNNLTKQTVEDAVDQYKRDRDPRELLFGFGRCVVHFALDDQQVRFCTQLKGKASWFLPFDKGWNDGAGNPPNPDGIKTDYLWRQILTPQGLTDIIENYAQIVTTKNPKSGKNSAAQIFPRYHQLDAVRKLLAHAAEHGVGQQYLIHHSAGSGKSNSIAWLAHQLIGVEHAGVKAFDSIIVVTDRVILDQQIRETIKSFAQVGSTVVHAERSGDLRTAIEAGKKIIVTTVQKFPYILDDIGVEHRGRKFAIVIDEAHSSQGGKTTAAVSTALSAAGAADKDETTEDTINRIMESRKMLPNASYFAFTATPKNKTLEIFGARVTTPAGEVTHRPFHSYTMKQAAQEGFILDVLKNYTPINSYYKLVKTIEADPAFDTRKASKKLRRYVESRDHAIRLKAEIMVDHYHTQVAGLQKIGGQARAMVVTNGIERAIQYYYAISSYLTQRKSPYKAIIAFSGKYEYQKQQVTEASINGFPSSAITDRIEEDPYRFLVCADKFQTGYDQPLLHTMYVDKPLSGVKAVQTLSRLNRAHPKKYDTAVLDFANDADTIERAFAPYYRTTVLAEETDPNKLHDLQADLDSHGVYTTEHVDQFVSLYLAGANRDQLDPILDACQAGYIEELNEDDQVDFKGKAKAFVRTYDFLAAILPFSNASWEKLSIFLNFLLPKLPAPKEDDLAAGILETIDMDSYRVEKRETMKIALADEDGALEPVPTSGGGHKIDSELERLSEILRSFNDHFGNIGWTDEDRVHRLITEDIPRRVAADKKFQNAQRNSDPQNARIEHDRALQRVMTAVLKDDTELFRQFSDNDSFKRWLADAVFNATYRRRAFAGPRPAPTETVPRRLERVDEPAPPPDLPPMNEPDPHEPTRMLLAQLPSRVPRGAELSLMVRIAIRRDAVPDAAAAPLRRLVVGPAGADVTVIVQASRGLVTQGPLEQVIHVPPTGDSEPVRFPVLARDVGLQGVRVSVWAGGTFLAELALEVSVSLDSPYVDAPPKTAHVGSVHAEPGEVTLQVRYDGQRYTFQLLSDSYLFEPVLAESLTAEPTVAAETAIATLHKMATGSSGYTSANARRWIKETGTGLWNDMVPEAIREQFWTVRSSIKSFSIATGRDTIPWELLYPLSASHDEGFLVEQFPVLRRVYDQQRTRSINMGNPRFVVPAGSPANAEQEIATIRRVLGDDFAAPLIIEDLDVLVDLIASGGLGLAHFACHNTYRAEAGGSSIQMGGGPFVPALLNSAVTQGSLAAHRPLVFINACRSAGATPQYTRMMGWAQQFMAAGAGAFLGTLWAVRSEGAAAFAEAFYGALHAGQPLGEAARQARIAASQDSTDPTWLAYTVYGDPAAHAVAM